METQLLKEIFLLLKNIEERFGVNPYMLLLIFLLHIF